MPEYEYPRGKGVLTVGAKLPRALFSEMIVGCEVTVVQRDMFNANNPTKILDLVYCGEVQYVIKANEMPDKEKVNSYFKNRPIPYEKIGASMYDRIIIRRANGYNIMMAIPYANCVPKMHFRNVIYKGIYKEEEEDGKM